MKLWNICVVNSTKYNEFLNFLLILDEFDIIYAEDIHELLSLLCLVLERRLCLHSVFHLPNNITPGDLFSAVTELFHATPGHLMVLHS